MERIFNYIYSTKNINAVIDEEGFIWFNGNDIASILDYKEPKKAIQKFVPEKNKNCLKDINIEIDNTLNEENELYISCYLKINFKNIQFSY